MIIYNNHEERVHSQDVNESIRAYDKHARLHTYRATVDRRLDNARHSQIRHLQSNNAPGIEGQTSGGLAKQGDRPDA